MTTLDEIDVTAADWRPSRVEARREIRRAVIAVARHHGGLVHIADVRPLLPAWVDGHQVGAYLCALVRQGVLVGTGSYRANGDRTSRNRTKQAEVRRLVGQIPEVAA